VRRIAVKQYTGLKADQPAIARRLARKIQGAIVQRQCLLLDFEGTAASPEFLDVLLSVAVQPKIRFCGLPVIQQQLVHSRQKEMS
jgi:hypothetical protein